MRHNSFLRPNSVKFGTDFNRAKKKFTQALLARLYVFPPLPTSTVYCPLSKMYYKGKHPLPSTFCFEIAKPSLIFYDFLPCVCVLYSSDSWLVLISSLGAKLPNIILLSPKGLFRAFYMPSYFLILNNIPLNPVSSSLFLRKRTDLSSKYGQYVEYLMAGMFKNNINCAISSIYE